MRTQGKMILDDGGKGVVLRGVSRYGHKYNTQATYDGIIGMGCNSVRVQMRRGDTLYPWATNPDKTKDTNGFVSLDKMISYGQGKLMFVLCQQIWGGNGPTVGVEKDSLVESAPGDFLATPARQQEWLDWWKMVVTYYKDNPAVIGFDLMNEPYRMKENGFLPPRNETNRAAYERIMKWGVTELEKIAPGKLFFIEEWHEGGFDFSDKAWLAGKSNVVISDHWYYAEGVSDGDSTRPAADNKYKSGDFAGGKAALETWIKREYVDRYPNTPFWVGEIGWATTTNWQRHMGDILGIFQKYPVGWAAFTFYMPDWGTTYELASASTPGTLSEKGTAYKTWMAANPVATPEPVKYKLSVSMSGSGAVTWTPDGTLFPAGTVVQFTAVPEQGWQGAATNVQSVVMDDNKAVMFKFTQVQYTVAITQVGLGSVGLVPEKDFYLYGDVVQVVPVPAEGWELKGVSASMFTVYGDEEVTVEFEELPVKTVEITIRVPEGVEVVVTRVEV